MPEIDAATQTKMEKVSERTLAMNVVRHEALGALLDDSRKGAFTARGTIDTSNPGVTELHMSTNNKADVTLYGINQKPDVAIKDFDMTMKNDMYFYDKDQNFKLVMQNGTEYDSSRGAGLVLERSSDSNLKAKLSLSGDMSVSPSIDFTTMGGVSTIQDSRNNTRTVLDLATTDTASGKGAEDVYLIKKGVDSAKWATIKDVPTDAIESVLHLASEHKGDSASIRAEIQPAHAVHYPDPVANKLE